MGDHDGGGHDGEGLAVGLTYSNPRVQRLRRLIGRRSARDEEGVLVVEGAPLVEQAIAAGWEVEAQFLAPGTEPLPSAGTAYRLAPNVLERVASTQTPQPLLAVVRQRRLALPAAVSFVVACDRLADPGNAGTIVRSAEASGADGVVFLPGSVDPFSPKVVRASAGSVFRLPVVEGDVDGLRRMGLAVLGTSSHRGTVYTEADLRRPVAILVGNEAQGLAEEATVDEWLTIPHDGPAESLNVAMAATLLAFEVARQRRGG